MGARIRTNVTLALRDVMDARRLVKLHMAWLLMAMAMACLGATELSAAEPVGVLVVEQGMVKVRRDNVEQVYRASSQKIPVYVGDELQSAKNTRAKVSLRNNTDSVNLYSSTFFRVDNVQPARSNFVLSIGKALFVAARRLSQEVFEVRTPTATIGVKGTEFVVGTDGAEKTVLLTVTGTVGLATLGLPGGEVLVGRDRASFVNRGKPPTPPIEVTPQLRDAIKGEDGLKSMIDLEAQVPPPPQGSGEKKKEEETVEQPQGKEEPPALTDTVNSIQDIQQDVTNAQTPAASSTTSQLQINISR